MIETSIQLFHSLIRLFIRSFIHSIV